ncbi:MAG: Fis family transcriptional regulator [Acidobacteria bacterium]|nr:MAG: Fis family transcriptional regulator [Acidobacteriota bacterium]
MSSWPENGVANEETSVIRPQLGDLWNEFVQVSGAGLAILDEQLRYVAINDLLAEMNGIPADAHIGNTIHDMLGDCAHKIEPPLRKVLGEGRPVFNYELNARLPANDQAGHWLEHYIPLRDEQGRVRWIGAIVIDLGSRKAGQSVPDWQVPTGAETSRQQMLLAFTRLALSRSLHRFFAELPDAMRQIILHDFGVLVLADSETDTFGAFGLGIDIGTDLLSREESTAVLHLFDRNKADDIVRILAVNDFAYLDAKLFAVLLQNRVKQACCIALKSSERKLGTLILCRTDPSGFRETETELAQQIGSGIILAIENLLAHKALRGEQAKVLLLNRVNSVLAKGKEFLKLAPAVAKLVRDVIPYDRASLAVLDQKSRLLNVYPLEQLTEDPECQAFPADESLVDFAVHGREPQVFAHDELSGDSSYMQHIVDQGTRSLCCVPLVWGKNELATLTLASNQEDAFRQENVDLLKQVAVQVALALDNSAAQREIQQLKQKLTGEKILTDHEIRDGGMFEDIIGQSCQLRQALAQVKIVAPSDATVLILGETGTGKELIARAIHRASGRREAVFAKLNCAAIPTGLLESELFGHEKGAFTGAISQKVGRLELADNGTLFLDEVGDIALELQPKLLRVLQDHEFERLGGTRTIHVNVRLVAATNRDLQHAVDDKQFRSDLFYRLKVFPIQAPPLRERKEDIPLLVHYFVKKFSRRMNKPIDSIPAGSMQALQEWDWPGNVRELENFIERSVILTASSILIVPLEELEKAKPLDSSLEALERDRIIHVLRKTRGIIAGVDGAAVRLGMKRTTLQSRITRLRIFLEDFR